jgi:hypothetical protein
MVDVPIKAAAAESFSIARRFMVVAEFCSRIKYLSASPRWTVKHANQDTASLYFEAGSINVRSVAGSSRFCIVIGSTVTITSSTGDAYAARTWPARVVPSGPPYAHALRAFPDGARYHRSSQSLRAVRPVNVTLRQHWSPSPRYLPRRAPVVVPRQFAPSA